MERFSHSRLDAFNKCPRKHHYMYREKIFSSGNEFLKLGDIFHRCIDAFYKGESYDTIIKEYEDKVKLGELSTESGMMEEVVMRYISFYDIANDNLIYSEEKIESALESGDVFVGVVDRVVEKDNMIVLRDTKTTTSSLKYTTNTVKYNSQLLTYVSLIQEEKNLLVDVYEIDEVRLAKIQPVPMNLNGKPSASKTKLDLVLYEDYYNKLCELELDTAPEYQAVLEYLEKRGHPLFNRVSVQLLDQNMLVSNLEDLTDSYRACKSGGTQRIRGPLCDYCQYSELCQLDYYNPDVDSRQIIIDKIKK